MNKVKYGVRPGLVISKYDGQYHIIGAKRLMQLYNVKPEECIIIPPGPDLDFENGTYLGIELKNLKILYPQRNREDYEIDE